MSSKLRPQGATKLMVVPSARAAFVMREILSDEWAICAPTAPLAGSRFEHIVVAMDLTAMPEGTKRQSIQQWLIESVHCRLVPGGKMEIF